MKTKLAIFDLDGTLFDTNDVNFSSYQTALNEEGYSLNYEYFCKECNGRHYTYFLPNIINSNDEQLLTRIHSRKKELYASYLNRARKNEHLFNIINSIKNEYYIGLVTTTSRENCNDILNYFDKKNNFDLIITQEDVVQVKPNPEGFIKAMEHFNVRPQDTIIFEDSTVGIEAAKKSQAIVYTVTKF